MRKLLLVTTALVGFAHAEPAEAAPVGAWVAGTVFGLSAGTAAFAVVSGVVTMAISVGLNLIAQKLRGNPKQEAVRTELTRPTSLPAYRFVYGKTWAPGTPVAWTVKGRVLYICYLLNSRPSAGPFTPLFDKRVVEKSGNEFDFGGGGGAVATNDPFSGHVRYWIGNGSQIVCPAQIVSETDGYFTASDAWQGRTVLWARLNCGDDEGRQERWPATPPELNVDGNWSLVRDPRTGGTLAFSRNQALIVLDALRNNPVRAYSDQYLRLDTFRWAADVADEAVAVKGGGTIPRYCCDGVLVFGDGAELEDQLQPLLAAGASRLTRIGGRLGIIPATPRPSVKTITDYTDGQPLDLIRWRSSDDLYTEAVARYPAPDRAYESAETPVYVVPGAQEADGGVAKRLWLDLDFVTDYRQAERLAKIAAERSRMQRGISFELFPDSFDLVAGSMCDVDLGSPFGAWQGKYEVDSISPFAGVNDDESITIRLPTVLTESSDAIYAWNAATEEQDVLAGAFDGSVGRVQPPPSIVMTTGTAAAEQSGDTVIPGVIAAWNGSPSASVTGYEYEWIVYAGSSGTPAVRPGGKLSLDAADEFGVFSVTLQFPQIGTDYQIRVRSIGTYGESEWRTSAPITAAGPSGSLPVPQGITAVAQGANRINVTATQAADPNARTLLIYGNDVDSSLTAELLWTVPAGASVSVARSETGLGSGTTRYYFARARDQWSNLSGFTDSASATTS
ncbi:phage tail protein [Paracoccus siganidrum]|uniref:Tip attachment protein J domain-containing protein n=1 Tax=Paracoccus siganidrum TaxID=1276757 RepID=A0A419A630_9RHOB|nr:phage tail protein [Paracoccus siganidrum]RJL13685.1 hypothetical protein D3P05_11800 [Paracoccus siganidrum]RMC33436.1 hypothetical protein C9E82_13380 [Paracoccus siganidrum]